MTEQQKKPHIRIHYVTPEQDGCVNGKCVGNTVGCWGAAIEEKGRSVCCNWGNKDNSFSTWFELISGALPTQGKE